MGWGGGLVGPRSCGMSARVLQNGSFHTLVPHHPNDPLPWGEGGVPNGGSEATSARRRMASSPAPLFFAGRFESLPHAACCCPLRGGVRTLGPRRTYINECLCSCVADPPERGRGHQRKVTTMAKTAWHPRGTLTPSGGFRGSVIAPGTRRASFFDHSPPVPVFAPTSPNNLEDLLAVSKNLAHPLHPVHDDGKGGGWQWWE